MPKHTPQNHDDPLPHSVRHYLDGNVPQGQRNNALHAAACQLRDIGMPQDEAAELLGERTRADGAPDSELQSTVASAYSRPARELPRGSSAGRSSRRYVLKRREPTGSNARRSGRSEPLPAPIEQGGFVAFLKAAFREGEGVCIAEGWSPDDSGRVVPKGSGTTLPMEHWVKKAEERGDFGKVMSCRDGVFVRVNPMEPKGKGRDEDATDYRHLLVEFDKDDNGNEIPKPQQYAAILDSHLPVTAVLDSGNKSLHAWVRVDASSKEQYAERAERVYAHFEEVGIDAQNKNPSRFSRAPDGKRTVDGEVVRQRLLKTGIGASSWDDWEKLGGGKDVLEEPVTGESIMAEFTEDPPFIVNGLASVGDKIILGGPSKAGKTFAMLGLASAVLQGGEWMGHQCRKGRVLLLNFEVKEGWLASRLRALYNAGVDLRKLEILNLRGKNHDTDAIIDSLGWKANMGKKYSLLIIDPLYKLLDEEAEENSNSDMARLMDKIEAMADKSGAAVVFAHHFSKGNKSATTAVDRMSGGGVLARDPDAIVTLTEHEEDACFVLECTTRNYAKPDPVVAEFQFPRFQLRSDLDPSDLRKPGGTTKKRESNTRYEMGKGNKNGRPSIFDETQKAHMKMMLDDNDGHMPHPQHLNCIADEWDIKLTTIRSHFKRSLGALPTKPETGDVNDEVF